MEGDYQPLCDIKGCIQYQCGEVIEIEVMPPNRTLVIRVKPCRFHQGILQFGMKFQVTTLK